MGVVSSTINTHFMSPSDYGDVRYVQNIINLMATLLLFGYFLSGSRLLALSNDEHKKRDIRGCMVIILAFASGILLLGTFINYFIHTNNPKLAYLFLVSLPVCLNPLLGNYVTTTAQGDNHIGRLSISTLVPSLLYIPIAYCIYNIYGATSYRMILLQWGIYSIVYLIVIKSTKPTFHNLNSTFKYLNIENKNYGIQLYYGSLVMVATNYIAGITLGIFNDDNVNVGFYTLALTVTSPLSALPSIIGTIYFKQFTTQAKIPATVLKVTLLMTILSCILFIIVIHPLVRFLFTDTYAMVGVYASWLAVGFCIHGLGDMINKYLGSHGQGMQIRNSSIACGIINVFGFTVFAYLWNIKGVLITNVVSSMVYCLFLLYYYSKFVKKV